MVSDPVIVEARKVLEYSERQLVYYQLAHARSQPTLPYPMPGALPTVGYPLLEYLDVGFAIIHTVPRTITFPASGFPVLHTVLHTVFFQSWDSQWSTRSLVQFYF